MSNSGSTRRRSSQRRSGSTDYNGVTEKFELQAVFTEYNTIDSMELPEEVLKEAEGSSSEGLLDGILPGI